MPWIPRDLERAWTTATALPVRILRGMRQCGKSSLLEHLAPARRIVTLDDAVARDLATRDPALFLAQHATPVTIDEVQYAPPLFPELKRLVDAERRRRRLAAGHRSEERIDVAWLTGSNQLLLEREVRESLAGRAHVDVLHTLSVHELVEGGAIDGRSPLEPMLRGGWPELYVDRELDPSHVLDDFILTYIEKDVVQAAGIEKRGAFLQLLRLLAGRTAQLQNHADLATKIGVQVSTVSGWVDVLERMLVIRRLSPWASNLEKRLTKAPKIYFLDVGLAARLQGWRSLDPLLDSPQSGALFESLVFGEIQRAIDNAHLPLAVNLWRTKEGEEVDFIVTRTDCGISAARPVLALDAKLAIQGVRPESVPRRCSLEFPTLRRLHLVSLGGERRVLSHDSEQIPLAQLYDLLCKFAGST
jgi:predicted AAA+ superfamily ATPase